MQEYKKLMNLIPKEQKLESDIKKLKCIIQSRDLQIKEQSEKLEQAKFVDVSNLSNVSISWEIFFPQKHRKALIFTINVCFSFFQEQIEVVNCLVHGIKKYEPYPESVRKFSMTQQYYSSAAYLGLRRFFNNNLPARRTLQMWYESVDGSPGVCESALKILREKAESYLEKNNHRLHLTMIWDEMAIKKELCWCAETQSFIGFSTVINSSGNRVSEDSSQMKLANEVLVFMVVGPDFKIAVGYELLSGLEGLDRAALVLNVIKRVEETGVIIVSLTGDALAANTTTYEALGVDFDNLKTYFHSPTYPQQKIYIIYDPPHMLKLVRKHFCEKNIYYQNQLVDWTCLMQIVAKQSSENFNLCNKLTKLHMNWSQKPMNVKLAVETLSKSVADTIHQLREDGYKEFENSESTEKFIRFFNNAFDILNFESTKKSDGRFKIKLCEDTAQFIFEFAENFKQFLSELELHLATKIEPILTSSAASGFCGLYFDFISLWGIYEDFVLNGPLQEFDTFQFSQDHLERFFSLIR